MGIDPDIQWMKRAMALALQAEELGEVPVGAILVRGEEVLAEGYNLMISSSDPSAHAEIITLRAAARAIKNYRLVDATLYVTVEPCTMCAGALVHARIKRLVFGAREPKAGAVCSSAQVLDNPGLNHKIEVTEGDLADQCGPMISQFFKRN